METRLTSARAAPSARLGDYAHEEYPFAVVSAGGGSLTLYLTSLSELYRSVTANQH